MVLFKNLLLATSVLLGAAAAGPAPAVARAVNGFAIESRDVNNGQGISGGPPKKKKCMMTKRGTLVITEKHDAANVRENEYVGPIAINSNDKKGTVVNLTGCTALFFYNDAKELRRVVHILCGHEHDDAKTAVSTAGGSTSVSIWASTDGYLKNAVEGIKAHKKDYKINEKKIYDTSKVTPDTAVTLTGKTGELKIHEGTGKRDCKQVQ